MDQMKSRLLRLLQREAEMPREALTMYERMAMSDWRRDVVVALLEFLGAELFDASNDPTDGRSPGA